MTLSEYEEKTKQLIDFLDEMEKKLKKISDDLNKKPREFWIEVDWDSNDYVFMVRREPPTISSNEIIHVKEVI